MRFVLAAIALVLAPMALAAQQPAIAQTADSNRAFAQWMVRVSAVVERASAANNLLSEFHQSFNPNDSRANQLAAMRQLRQHAEASRPELAAAGQELAAIGAFQHAGADPELVVFSRSMIQDTQAYLRNMDEILDAMIDAIDAFERNDRAAFAAVSPRLVRGASLLLDGQIMMFRGRQRTVPVTESSHHGLGAMVAMYEGMRAIIMPNIANRDAALRAAADSAAGYSVSGRAALALQRASVGDLSADQRRIVNEMFAYEEQFYAANDRVVALLRAAAQEAAAGTSAMDLNTRYTADVAAVELEYQRINAAQVALFSQLTQ